MNARIMVFGITLGVVSATAAAAQYGPVDTGKESCNRLEALEMSVRDLEHLGPDDRSAENLKGMLDRIETDRNMFSSSLEGQSDSETKALSGDVRKLEEGIKNLSNEATIGQADSRLSDRVSDVQQQIKDVYQELNCNY